VTQNAKLIKDILDTKTFKENPKFQKSVATEPLVKSCQTEGGEDIKILQKENAKLKSRIFNLEVDLKGTEASDDNSDALYYLLSYLQENDFDVMIKMMRDIKKDYPLAYENQKPKFGSDFDESLISDESSELSYLFPSFG
jgi:hypothetical protein